MKIHRPSGLINFIINSRFRLRAAQQRHAAITLGSLLLLLLGRTDVMSSQLGIIPAGSVT